MARHASWSLIPHAWSGPALQLLQPSAEANPWGPLSSAADMCRGADLWEYVSGDRHAWLAVRPLALAHGRRLDVAGLVSDGARLTPEDVHQAMQAMGRAYRAQLVAMSTARPHLVRTCQRAGFAITGAVMRQEVNP